MPGEKQYLSFSFEFNMSSTFIGQKQIGFWKSNTMSDQHGEQHLVGNLTEFVLCAFSSDKMH